MRKFVTKRIVALLTAFCMLALLGCSFDSDKIHSSAAGSGANSTGGITASAAAGSAIGEPSAVAAETSEETPQQAAKQREDVSFSEMVYERPDIDGMEAQLDDLKNGIVASKPAPDLISAYRSLQDQYAHADSMLSLAYLLYAFDVTKSYYRDEYAYLQSALNELDVDMQSVSAELFESSSEAEQNTHTLPAQSGGSGVSATGTALLPTL